MTHLVAIADFVGNLVLGAPGRNGQAPGVRPDLVRFVVADFDRVHVPAIARQKKKDTLS